GDTGPCGPSSEIHIDLRSDEEIAKRPGRELVNTDNDEVIEIWNLVFMQFNRKADGHLEPLPAKNIDTGMGFERLCMILQNKKSNYETDVFSGIIGKVEEFSGHKYTEGGNVEVAMRVIADHVRAIAFSIADGQLPSNVKAGYVIRRILRRAVRYGYTFLGFEEPFLCRLIPQLVSDMGEAYPELKAQQTLIENVIREEENAFLKTLDRGIKMLDDKLAENAASKTLPGTDAFVLYDTYGFPIDLTELIATEKGFTVDLEGFNAELQKQKDRARSATANEFGDWVEFVAGEEVTFTGYDTLEEPAARLLKHRTVKQKNKVLYQLVFDRTPFYAEMGGQVGDTGVIENASGEKINILNTVKENNLTIHLAERIPEDCESLFRLSVDKARRARIAANHTATHLMDEALREVLGTHVEQKGSFVGPDYLRFDFSHFAKMSDEEIAAVEHKVNAAIRANYVRKVCETSMEEAQKMGAIALFGEKYGEKVRVVNFGSSTELCGGTHAGASGEIGFFKIVSESAIAAGVRRIEAITGEAAEKFVDNLEGMLRTVKALFNNVPDLTGAIKKMIEDNADARKQLEAVAAEKAAAMARKLEAEAEVIGGVRVAKYDLSADPTLVRNVALALQKQAENLVLAGAYSYNDKPNLVLMYSADLVAKGKHAGKDIGIAAKLIQGGGGGQPGLATAGGKNLEGLKDALEKLVELATA
ncbi:MAG: alanine--tRNA ligase, partial [Bacteroidales bacterium]|nr:alanine--tRNA ligase [Bacteroidales bacterium]